jgi:hypothetical protein
MRHREEEINARAKTHTRASFRSHVCDAAGKSHRTNARTRKGENEKIIIMKWGCTYCRDLRMDLQ